MSKPYSAAGYGCRKSPAADLIKLAMIAVHRYLQNEKMQSRIIMQVHDELVLEVPEAEHHRQH